MPEKVWEQAGANYFGGDLDICGAAIQKKKGRLDE
jgi:hypothetical protein